MTTILSRVESLRQWEAETKKLVRARNKEIGAHAKEARIAAGLTQTALAERMDTSSCMLNGVEVGRTPWTPSFAKRWQAAIDARG